MTSLPSSSSIHSQSNSTPDLFSTVTRRSFEAFSQLKKARRLPIPAGHRPTLKALSRAAPSTSAAHPHTPQLSLSTPLHAKSRRRTSHERRIRRQSPWSLRRLKHIMAIRTAAAGHQLDSSSSSAQCTAHALQFDMDDTKLDTSDSHAEYSPKGLQPCFEFLEQSSTHFRVTEPHFAYPQTLLAYS